MNLILGLLLIGNVWVAYLLRRRRQGAAPRSVGRWIGVGLVVTVLAFTPVAVLWALVYTPWAAIQTVRQHPFVGVTK